MWDRCWSTAVIRLGLTTEQFLRLTPRQLRVLADKDWERIEQQREHAELLAGMITANTVNYSFCRPKEPKKIADFMPSKWVKSTESERQSVANSIRKFFNRKMAKQAADAAKGIQPDE